MQIKEHIEFKVDSTWERMMTGKVCGTPIVKVDAYFPGHIIPDENFLKAVDGVFQEIARRYKERLGDQD